MRKILSENASVATHETRQQRSQGARHSTGGGTPQISSSGNMINPGSIMTSGETEQYNRSVQAVRQLDHAYERLELSKSLNLINNQINAEIQAFKSDPDNASGRGLHDFAMQAHANAYNSTILSAKNDNIRNGLTIHMLNSAEALSRNSANEEVALCTTYGLGQIKAISEDIGRQVFLDPSKKDMLLPELMESLGSYGSFLSKENADKAIKQSLSDFHFTAGLGCVQNIDADSGYLFLKDKSNISHLSVEQIKRLEGLVRDKKYSEEKIQEDILKAQEQAYRNSRNDAINSEQFSILSGDIVTSEENIVQRFKDGEITNREALKLFNAVRSAKARDNSTKIITGRILSYEDSGQLDLLSDINPKDLTKVKLSVIDQGTNSNTSVGDVYNGFSSYPEFAIDRKIIDANAKSKYLLNTNDYTNADALVKNYSDVSDGVFVYAAFKSLDENPYKDIPYSDFAKGLKAPSRKKVDIDDAYTMSKKIIDKNFEYMDEINKHLYSNELSSFILKAGVVTEDTDVIKEVAKNVINRRISKTNMNAPYEESSMWDFISKRKYNYYYDKNIKDSNGKEVIINQDLKPSMNLYRSPCPDDNVLSAVLNTEVSDMFNGGDKVWSPGVGIIGKVKKDSSGYNVGEFIHNDKKFHSKIYFEQNAINGYSGRFDLYIMDNNNDRVYLADYIDGRIQGRRYIDFNKAFYLQSKKQVKNG